MLYKNKRYLINCKKKKNNKKGFNIVQQTSWKVGFALIFKSNFHIFKFSVFFFFFYLFKCLLYYLLIAVEEQQQQNVEKKSYKKT